MKINLLNRYKIIENNNLQNKFNKLQNRNIIKIIKNK